MKHYIGMSGSHGCLPDYNSGSCRTKLDAALAIANVFDKSDSWARKFASRMYHDFKPGEGASYAEIMECDCAKPSEHCEPGCGCDFCDGIRVRPATPEASKDDLP